MRSILRLLNSSTKYGLIVCFSWEERLVLCERSSETAYLLRELGRCKLELERVNEAKQNAKESCQIALTTEDKHLQLESHMLLATVCGEAGLY